MESWIRLAGVAQLALAAASLAIPRALGWKEKLAAVDALTRAAFWNYAGYILGTNAAIGLLSALAPGLLTDGTPLARSVAGFVAVYWGARLAVQVLVFRRLAPAGRLFCAAELALTALFAGLAAVYAVAALRLEHLA